MKRFHVHVAVPDLQTAIRFYSTMFGAQPTVVKPDYAKWMMEEPCVNFAISQRGEKTGINHLGFQVDDASELAEIHSRLAAADAAVVAQAGEDCCYAKSDKYWVTDPAGVPWESFRSLRTIPFFSGEAAATGKSACCAPSASIPVVTMKAKAPCCP